MTGSHFKKLFFSGIFLLLLLLPAWAEGYHNYQALSTSLQQLAAQHPDLVKLTAIGTTLKGKKLWLVQVSGPKGGSPLEKQALLICANAEGDHLVGSEVALGIVRYLTAHYGKDKTVTDVLGKRTFYIVPRLNPDGAEYFFKKVKEEHPGNLRPRDDDYDWLIDEDAPEDINGDGMITLMRVRDKKGQWIKDKKDPRLMTKKEADTPLDELYQVYPEGKDDDNDGRYNEDGPGGFNINRNFPHNFGYQPKGRGVYPASEVETQALIDFMSRYVPRLKTQPHRNVGAILIFSKYDNLAGEPGIECGTPTFPSPPALAQAPTMGRRFSFRRGQAATPQTRPRDPQPKKTNTRDLPLFKRISAQYKKMTGIKSAISTKPVGSILEWGYFQFGVPTFSASLWSVSKSSSRMQTMRSRGSSQPRTTTARRMSGMPNMAMFRRQAARSTAGETSNTDKEWLSWIDKKNKGKGFVPWTPFKHPQLGKVEIGGFQPYLRINPPAEKIKELGEKHAQFAIWLASQLSEISLQKVQVKRLSTNLYELKATVINNGRLPYATAMGQRSRNITPIMVQIKFRDDKKMKLFGGSKRHNLNNLEPAEEKEFKWLIISPSGQSLTLTLWARSGGGQATRTITLK